MCIILVPGKMQAASDKEGCELNNQGWSLEAGLPGLWISMELGNF